MKLIYILLFTASPIVLFSQQTITSIANGIASNPLVWDCTCFPTPNDHVIIKHDIVMNTNWLINAGGSVTVNYGASLKQDNQNRYVLIDGSGSSFTNHGITQMTTFGLSNGSVVHNHHNISLDSTLWVGVGSTYMNHGNTIDLDSTYIQGTLINEGVFKKGDFLNDGTVSNTGYMHSDSLLNRGAFISSAGSVEAYDFGNNGNFEIKGASWVVVSNNAINDGTIKIAPGRSIHIGNDFSNVNTTAGSTIINNGLFEVSNDFLNMDTLRGTGIFCIGESSANHGVVMETLDICDNTGGGFFDLNTGTISTSVTSCISGCNVGVLKEISDESISIYPNPVINTLNIQGELHGTYAIIDITGKQVLSGNILPTIDLSNLFPAIYFIRLNTLNGISTIKFIKN